MEPRARLQSKIEKGPFPWFEGFTRIIQGEEAAYENHRSNGLRDSALVVRTSEPDSPMEWQTNQIPLDWQGDTARFLWTCGFGSNQGNVPLDLFVNGNNFLTFTTSREAEWNVTSPTGGNLTFTLMGLTQYGASLGYMSLELPRRLCNVGHSVNIQVRPQRSSVEVWYRLYECRDSYKYFITNEAQSVYYSWSDRNLDDVILSVITQSKFCNQHIEVTSARGMLGSDSLVLHGPIVSAEIRVPRERQVLLSPPLIARIGQETADTISLPDIAERRIKAFMEEEVIFTNYLFPPGECPRARWKNPNVVGILIGSTGLKVSYYDSKFRKVERASIPGRYGAMIECTTETGFVVRRFASLYSIPLPYDRWREQVLKPSPKGVRSIGTESWNKFQRSEIAKFCSQRGAESLQDDQTTAEFFAGLSGMKSGNDGNDSPQIHNRQWWIDFKRNVLGYSQSRNQLHLTAQMSNQNQSILKRVDALLNGYQKKDIEEIKDICSKWAEQSGEPNVTLVACEGKVIFHESFNKKTDSAFVGIDTPMWMASITKLLTGTLMMQFVDQNIVNLDERVTKYLPELPTDGVTALTVRDLFTHTNGFAWHGEWASDWNMSLENNLAQCLPVCRIREKHQYNRMGYAVAGKIMERISGRSVPYLFNAFLLEPLGMSKTFVDNTYGSCQSTAYDIALVGQMLLDRGKAGSVKFFSEKSFSKMLPEPIVGPKGKVGPDWGIGTSWLGGNGLSKSSFGHEAASGAILRIDPELRLVVVSARNRIGPSYSAYESFKNRLLSAVVRTVKNMQARR